jgi:hypothetical protein
MKEINDGDSGYLCWMSGKYSQELGDDHVVKKSLLQWDERTSRSTTTASGISIQPATTPGTSTQPTASGTTRFKDVVGNPMWIDGWDISGLFHMNQQQLQRRQERPIYPHRRFIHKRYLLQQVYEAALRTPSCPIDETPDQALERYLAKVKKCGKDTMFLLNPYCDC